MECKYCGKSGIKNSKGLATHRRFNKKCFDQWKKEQDDLKKNKTYVICEICGKKLRNISNTHLKKHNITQKEYKKRYPDSKIFADGLLDIQKKHREYTITERYIKNNINIYDTNSKKYFIKKYGNDKGNIYYDINCKKLKKQNTLEWFIERYGEKIGLKKYEKRHNKFIGIFTLEWFIERYGEKIGLKKYEKRSKALSYGHSIDYYISKYGEEKGCDVFKKICDKKANSLSNFKRIYGEEIGLKKYESYMKKRPNFFSKMASSLFEIIDLKINHELYFATINNPKEFGMMLKNNQYVFVDLYDKTSNKIIEFYGDYWHCNPKIYKFDEYIKYPNKVVNKVEMIWKKDEERINEIKKLKNCEILIIWEKEYVEDPEITIKKCIDFLTK